AWLRTLLNAELSEQKERETGRESINSKALRAVSERAAQTLGWWTNYFINASLFDIPLDYLTLGRASLYEALLVESNSSSNNENLKVKMRIDDALNGLRGANAQEFIVRGLLARAWLRFVSGPNTGPKSAQEDLDEAWEIAQRGPMRLHMADIHLHRARLFFREAQYPWESQQADLAAAEKLINECGYHRRDEELADAKAAIL